MRQKLTLGVGSFGLAGAATAPFALLTSSLGTIFLSASVFLPFVATCAPVAFFATTTVVFCGADVGIFCTAGTFSTTVVDGLCTTTFVFCTEDVGGFRPTSRGDFSGKLLPASTLRPEFFCTVGAIFCTAGAIFGAFSTFDSPIDRGDFNATLPAFFGASPEFLGGESASNRACSKTEAGT